MAELYDIHTHVGLDLSFYLRGWWPYAATAQDLLSQMAQQGIDRAVCFPFTNPSAYDPVAFADRHAVELLSGRVPFDRENGLLAQEIAHLDVEHRLKMLAMFDPSRKVDEQLTNLEPLLGRIAGLKVQTTTIESPIRNLLGTGRVFLEWAETHNLPVLMHTAIFPQDPWSQVSDCLEIAAAFPGVRFDLAHSLRLHAGHLEQASQMKNVWVDCAAHLAHCLLARENSPFVAAPADRVDADYTKPAEVLAVIHEMLGGRYLWGSDAPFMSWCEEGVRIIFTYEQETDVLRALPEAVRLSMAHTAPEAWLFGKEESA